MQVHHRSGCCSGGGRRYHPGGARHIQRRRDDYEISPLVGDNDANTIIDATGKVNGITIMDTKAVSVSGFTVENAQAAGIWITGSSFVTIFNNRVINNDRALIPGANASCPPLKGTPFEAGEAEDCGEGVFLSAVDHSILSGNLITGNAGGILITDDTGPTHDNLISGNSVVRNTALDCGITLPSHSTGGVYHNTVSGNDSSYNGGPGVGIFAPGPGSKAYGNVVINNHLRGNGLPGVTMHNHAAPGVNGVPPGAPPPNFNDNVIVGNDISANAADTEDAATGGTTGINIYSVGPMTGTIISQNVIHQRDVRHCDQSACIGRRPDGAGAPERSTGQQPGWPAERRDCAGGRDAKLVGMFGRSQGARMRDDFGERRAVRAVANAAVPGRRRQLAQLR